MEEESEKLRQLQSEVDKQLSVPTSPNASLNMSFEESEKLRQLQCEVDKQLSVPT